MGLEQNRWIATLRNQYSERVHGAPAVMQVKQNEALSAPHIALLYAATVVSQQDRTQNGRVASAGKMGYASAPRRLAVYCAEHHSPLPPQKRRLEGSFRSELERVPFDELKHQVVWVDHYLHVH